MDDVTRALERAVKVNLRHRITGVYPTTSEEAVRDILLAFLKAMPAMTRHKISTGDGGHAYSPDGWNLHALAAAIRARGEG